MKTDVHDEGLPSEKLEVKHFIQFTEVRKAIIHDNFKNSINARLKTNSKKIHN